MSRIYFHSRDGGAEVLGSERAHCGVMCSDLLWLSLGIHFESDERLTRLVSMFPDGHYLRELRFKSGPGQIAAVRSALSVDGELVVDGESEPAFRLGLNTAARLGDPIRLLARIHGQCEIHGWVSGLNRGWLASRIEEARDANLLRAGAGWESVIDLLRAWRATRKRTFLDDAVVTSYSVCEPFPNAGIAINAGTWTLPDPEVYEGEPWDAWYDLSDDEQWSRALAALPSQSPEWSPATWDGLFGSGLSGWDLSERLSRTEVPS